MTSHYSILATNCLLRFFKALTKTLNVGWNERLKLQSTHSYPSNTEKHAPPAAMVKREGQRQLPARFEGEPTYKSKLQFVIIVQICSKMSLGWTKFASLLITWITYIVLMFYFLSLDLII